MRLVILSFLLALAVEGNRNKMQMTVQSSSEPITVGRTLTVTLSGWTIGGAIKIKSTGEDVGLIFEFAKVNNVKFISRVSNYSNQLSIPETFGGWPLGPTSRAATLAFTLTASKFEVSVDNLRAPWFDFSSRGHTEFPGFEIVNLQMSAPPSVSDRICSIECFRGVNFEDPEKECLCGLGSCTIKLPPSQPGDAQICSDSGSDGECCTGTKELLTLRTIDDGDAAVLAPLVPDDPTFLDRACASADVHNTCVDIKKEQANQGATSQNKVFIVSKERDNNQVETGRVIVYFPTSHARLAASPWMFIKMQPSVGTVQLTGNPYLTIDQGIAQVVGIEYGQGRHPISGVKPMHYITRLKQGSILSQFTMKRLTDLVATGAAYEIIYSDAPRLIVEEDCQSNPTWTDGQTAGFTCQRYGGQDGGEPWCTKFGLRTKAFKLEVCNGGDCTFDQFKSNGLSALDACCACGGGVPSAQ